MSITIFSRFWLHWGCSCLFLDSSIQGKIDGVAVRIAPATLSVSAAKTKKVRYAWQKWLVCEQIDGCTAVAVVDGTCCCCGSICTGNGEFCAESYLRDGLLCKIFLHIRPYRSLTEKIRDVDTMFKER